MLNASAEMTLGGSETADVVGQHVHQLGLCVRSAVGQATLEMIPYAFIGIQFGRVCREGHQVKTACSGKEFLHRLAAMNITIVQQNDEMAAHLAQQMAKEHGDFFALNVVLIEMTVQRAVEGLWTDGYAGYGGDAVMAIVIGQDGGLPHRTPCLADSGNQ